MKGWKRLVYYLLINVLVSACTVWVALTIWDRTHPEAFGGAIPLDLGLFNRSQTGTPTPLETQLVTPAPPLPSLTTSAIHPVTGTAEVPVTPTTSASGQEARLAITNVFGAGDLATERVRVAHIGEVELYLESWRLQDEDGNTFTFPRLTMYAGGVVDIYTRTGRNSVNALYWGQEQAVWTTGEVVTLLDESGNVQATYRVP
jgi:hypothetical protein